MNDFKFGNKSRDRRDSPRRSFRDRDSRRSSLHDAVCDECGKDCQVPFKPSGDKPIYCSDCFEKKGGRDSRSSQRGSRQRNYGDRDRGRPQQSNISDRSTSQLVEKIGALNSKLDTIISLLSSKGEKKSDFAEAKTEKSKKSKSIIALAPIEEKDSDLKKDNAQENIKSKPKKKAKTKSKAEKKSKPVNKSKSKKEESQ